MTKNLFAFIASTIAIFFLYNWFLHKAYPNMDQVPSAKAGAALTPVAFGVSSSAVAQSRAASAPALLNLNALSKAKPQSLTVSTQSMEVVLSTLGAKAISWKLLAFRETAGHPEPVQLLPDYVENGNYGAYQLVGAQLENQAWILETPKPQADAKGNISVVFRAPIPGTPISFRKTFSFEKSGFVVHLKLEIINNGKQDFSVQPSFLLWGPNIGKPDIGRAAAIAGGAAQMEGDLERVRPTVPSSNPQTSYGAPKWIAVKSHYFLAAFINDASMPEGQLRQGTPGSVTPSVTAALGLGAFTIHAGEDKAFETRLYVGPQDVEALEAFNVNLEKVVQFSFQWLNPLSRLLIGILKFFYTFSGNWGVAVILLTLFVRLALFWPMHTSMVNARRMQTKMALMKPVLDSLKQSYKDDAAKLQQETMKLYKEHGVNPLGGCVWMLPQFIIMAALYGAVNGSFQLRGAPFFGPWTDLSAPDPTYLLVPLMCVSMFVQQRMAPTQNAASTEEQAQMQKTMMWMMPAMFLFMGYKFAWPTGLLLYWGVSNVIGILQQWIVNRTVK